MKQKLVVMKKTVRQNKLFFGIVFVEVLFLALMMLKAVIRAPYQREFGPEELNFQYEEDTKVSQNEEGVNLISGEDESASADAWITYDFQVQKGSYRIYVDYVADEVAAKESYFRIYSKTTRNYFSDDTYSFNPLGETSQVEIETLSKTRDLNVVVHYGGTGTLGIKSIRIKEIVWYRLGKIIQTVILYLLIDMLYLVFFGEDLIKINQKQRKICFLLFGTIAFASFPLIMDFQPTGHDIYFHMGRIQGIADALKYGQFPVRSYPTSYNGYGYACSLFYGEIFLYLPAVLHILGIPLYRSYQMYMILVNIVTCLVTYVCFRNMFRNEKAGILGAFFYTCSAYRLVNMLHRSAVGEFTAMLFFPLLVYAAWILVSKESNGKERKYVWLYFTIGMTGLIQTHIISVEMTVIFLGIFCVLFWKSVIKKRNLPALIKAVVVTILLNLWFLVPFLEYFQGNYYLYTRAYKALDMFGLYLQQIFGAFFGGSGLNVWNGMKQEMPLTIGFTLTLGLIGFIAFRIWNGRCEERIWKLGFYVTVFGGIAVWMTSIYCPWNKVREWSEQLAKYVIAIQFPWRYLAIATVFLCVTSVCLIMLVEHRYHGKMSNVLAIVLISVNIFTVGYFYSDFFDNYYKEETQISMPSERLYFDSLYFLWGINSDTFIDTDLQYDEALEIMYYRVERGESIVSCVNDTDREIELTFPIVHYKDYQVRDEKGEKLQLVMGDKCQVTVIVPAGYHGTMHVKFTSPLRWRVCELISLISLIGVVIWIIISGKKEKVTLARE